MTLAIFLKIFSVCLLGAMSPGPSMVVIINNAIFKSRYHGILASLGHGFGIGTYALFAVLGIAIIIKTNIHIFNGIKIVSILFLIYLGIKSISSQKKIDFVEKNLGGGIKSFFQGLTIALLNPKVLVWFIAIYSQFMSTNNDKIFNAYLILTASIVDAAWYIILSFLVTSNIALEVIKDKIITLQKLVGSLFIFIAILLSLQILIKVRLFS